MRSLIVIVLILIGFSIQAQAPADSVGVFHKPDKVIVLLNERGAYGRIQQFMDLIGDEDSLYWLSADESVKLQCARTNLEASCTFRFLPSALVEISGRGVRAFVTAEDLNKSDFEMTFQSSMEDRLVMKMTAEGLSFWAGKRGEKQP